MRKDNLEEEKIPAEEGMEEKIERRERKKKKRMPISGKSVFKERELRIRNNDPNS